MKTTRKQDGSNFFENMMGGSECTVQC